MNMNLLLDIFDDFDDFEDIGKSFEKFTTLGMIISLIFAVIFIAVFVLVVVKVVKHVKLQGQIHSTNHEQPKPEEEIKKEKTTYCEYCGGIMEEGNRACPSCGAKRTKIE